MRPVPPDPPQRLTSPEQLRRDLGELFARDPAAAVAAVFERLAGEPRVKPSRGLLIDPHDEVWRRWQLRVAAAVALVESPHALRVVHELRDEFAGEADLRRDVLAVARPYPGTEAAFGAASAGQ